MTAWFPCQTLGLTPTPDPDSPLLGLLTLLLSHHHLPPDFLSVFLYPSLKLKVLTS